MPQVTAVQSCSKVCHDQDIPCIVDGGIKYSGDIVKALAIGAHVTMLGSMLAGLEESPGEIILYEGRRYKVYRGMGSVGAVFVHAVAPASETVPAGQAVASVAPAVSTNDPAGAVRHEVCPASG